MRRAVIQAGFALFALFVIVVAAPAGSDAATDDATTDVVTITTADDREIRFEVEIAADPASRARGLMHRTELAADHGMLFLFDRDGEVAMWMKNTFISLDMLFIEADGRIHRIAAGTEPMSLRTIQSGGPVRAVLEIPAGVAALNGLRQGDMVAGGGLPLR